jgi:hypothetical protein
MEMLNQAEVQFEAQPAENLVLTSEQETQVHVGDQVVEDLIISELPEIPHQEDRPLFVVDGIAYGQKFVAASVASLLLGLFAPWVLSQGEIGSLYSQKEIGVANELSSREAQLRPIEEAIRNLSN